MGAPRNNPVRQLIAYRDSIDNLDAALVVLLAERFKVTQRVGMFKRDNGLPPADKSREKLQIDRLRALARSAQLDPDFTEKLLAFITREVIHHHERLRREGNQSHQPDSQRSTKISR